MLGISSQISLILRRIYEGKWHPPRPGFWGGSTGSGTAIHVQAWASTGWARASMSKHHQLLEFSNFGRFNQISPILWRIYKGKWHLPKQVLGSPEFRISIFFNVGHFEPDITDFVKNLWREMTPSNIWILGSEHGLEHGHSRASMSKHRLSTSKHKQARANFGIFWFWAFRARYHRFCADFLKEMTPSKNRILGSPEFQIPKFFDLGHFEPDITHFKKNSWREMTPSQIWILGSEHGLGHGHSRASMSKHRLNTSNHEQARANFGIFQFLGVLSQTSPILWIIYKEKWQFPNIGF